MSRLFSRAALLLALSLALPAGGAKAGVGDRAGNALLSFKDGWPIERAQYFSLGDQDYCWYDSGWQGPGWYWCGYEQYQGYGWGGPYGWNGWGGGYSINRHRPHGVGVWRPGPPSRGIGAGGAPPGPVAPGLHGGGEGFHHFGATGAQARPALPGDVSHGGEAPAFHGAGGGGVQGFGGGRGPQGFGGGGHTFGGGGLQGFGGGGFHGGGGAFSPGGGGHGGGHR
jgi:hypothetical protein